MEYDLFVDVKSNSLYDDFMLFIIESLKCKIPLESWRGEIIYYLKLKRFAAPELCSELVAGGVEVHLDKA